MNSSTLTSKAETGPRASTPLVWIGLDWADKKHYLAVLRPGAKAPTSHQLPQKPEDLDAFFGQLAQEMPGAQLGVCIEQSRGPVIYALMKYKFITIYPISPRSLADFRQAFTVSGAKSDPRDGDLLCEMGAKHHHRLRPLPPEDACTRELRLTVEMRRHFVEERTAQVLQLQAALKCYYPLVLDLFGAELACPMGLEFLRRWPNLQKLKVARPAVLRAFFYKYNSRSEERIQKRLDAILAAQALTEDPAIVAPFQLKVLCLVAQIQTLDQAIEKFATRSQQVFQQHDQASLFAQLPGAGAVLAPRLAALFGTSAENWSEALDLQCWIGTAPVRKQSGQKSTVHFRRARPYFVHQSLVEFAKGSVLFCDWARLLYEDQLAKGKSKFAALRVVGFKWVRILFRCWKNHVAYDEIRYLRSLQKKGVKLYASLYAQLPPEPQPL